MDSKKRLFSIKANPVEELRSSVYTNKITIPQYLPSPVCPKLYELVDTTVYTRLIRDINQSDVSVDVKEFLKVCATRHIVFNYSKIADYYAHSDKEIQKLMEESALVIIDVDDAIANGYVKLSKNIETIMKKSGVVASEE